MNLRTLLKAGDAVYQYSDEDKKIIRKMAEEDKEGLLEALRGDPLLKYLAEHSYQFDRY